MTRDFARFCRLIGLNLQTWQRDIVDEALAPRRELVVLIPRGNGKTTLMAALGLFQLLRDPHAAIVCAAASREQAGHLFDKARGFALANTEVRARLTITRRDLRTVSDGRLLVVSADAEKQLGWDPSLIFLDELCAHRDADLYTNLRTSLVKRPDAKLITISTAGVGADSPLGQLRQRALALPEVYREGTFTRAAGTGLAMLEWALPDEWDLERAHEANPATWVTPERLEEQREAVHESAFRRFHANQWTAAESYWLPPGAWQACVADYTIDPGEPVWVGVDVGGSRAASAVVWLTEDLRVGCEVFQGTEAVLAVQERVRRLAEEQDVRAVYFDPWRFQQAALELEQGRLTVVEFPQSHSRMVPASERLYAAIVEGRLQHPNDPDLNRHVAAAVAKDTPRGWRLDKSNRNAQIDAVVALAMALEGVTSMAEPSVYETRGVLAV